LAVSAGLAEYRPGATPQLVQWTERYESGGWDYLAGIHQLSQYSMLVGYISFLGAETILDVGCGTGLLRARLDGVNFKSYLGIDPVEVAIEKARALEDERTTFRIGDAFMPDLGEFDAVVCNEVFYCIPEPLQLIERTRELVRPGGYLLSSNLHHPGDRGLHRMIDERFELVADVDVTSRTDRGVRSRRIAVHRRR
jgi:2-polyprenyl-3-methyl-5-hydroxy-6-metoxy-1,4-benzoquinol methylase